MSLKMFILHPYFEQFNNKLDEIFVLVVYELLTQQEWAFNYFDSQRKCYGHLNMST